MDNNARRSYTAEGVAALRAAGTHETDAALRNPDDLAESLIGGWMAWAVHFAPLRRIANRVMNRKLPGIYPFVTARTKFFDAALEHEIDRGVQQVVVLGAGADSRAHRFVDRLSNVTVYELDHPATSAWKQRKASHLGLPGAVTYVPIDFGSASLAEVFDGYGVSRHAVTLFLWEGVTPYLDEASVSATLTEVARFASDSSLVFDYIFREALNYVSSGPEAVMYRTYLDKQGEPLRFGFDSSKLEGYLAEFGLSVESHALPEDLAREQLGGKATPTSFSAILHARVKASRPR